MQEPDDVDAESDDQVPGTHSEHDVDAKFAENDPAIQEAHALELEAPIIMP